MLSLLLIATLGAIGTLGLARRALVRGRKGHAYCGAAVFTFFCIPLSLMAFESGFDNPFPWQPFAALGAGVGIMVILGPFLVPSRSRLRPSDRTFI